MYRLLFIVLCHLSVYLAFVICDHRHPYDVDAFDLMRHNGYIITMAIVMYMEELKKEAAVEKHVTFLKFMFVWGVLVNCFLFNLSGDRDFHWYSIPIVLMATTGAVKKAYPLLHGKLCKKVPLYKYLSPSTK